MKRKFRVDFSAHTSIVVSVDESDDMYDEAARVAEEYVDIHSETPYWEVDDDGVDEADDDEEAVNE